MASVSYGTRVHGDARMVSDLLATRFLSATRRELRAALQIDSSRLYRALLHLEDQGILLVEYSGRLALVDRLWGSRKAAISRHGNGVE